MKNIIVYLALLRMYAKDLHYAAKGDNFYAIHLLMDRVSKDLNDFIDQIKENHFMANSLTVPIDKDIYSEAISFIDSEYKPSLEYVLKAVKMALFAVQEANSDSRASVADQDLLGAIASYLANSKGLVEHSLPQKVPLAS